MGDGGGQAEDQCWRVNKLPGVWPLVGDDGEPAVPRMNEESGGQTPGRYLLCEQRLWSRLFRAAPVLAVLGGKLTIVISLRGIENNNNKKTPNP